MVDQTPLTAAEIEAYFAKRTPSIGNTFQFNLVLGGTVSAGSYTAGVLDFLIEALDCWTGIRDQEAPGPNAVAPRHRTILNLIAGTSGGGVNAAIAARALAYDFPHVTRGTPASSLDGSNPFYDVWVNQLTLSGLLDTSDIDDKKFVSLLNGKPIDLAAEIVAKYARPQQKPRSWLGTPFRTILTLTNLRGIPYQTDMGGGLSETFIDHADFARFAFAYPGRPFTDPRPDEFVLGFDAARRPQAMPWDEFSQYARATAAFPVGFPARALVRPVEHYRYRVMELPDDTGRTTIIPRLPDWDMLRPAGGGQVPADYHFLSVDGGATDNEPIALARVALSGMSQRNPRKSIESDRAVVLVDPFAGQAGLGPDIMGSFPSLFGALVNTFTQQTRYDSQDLLLAANKDVFSRFLVAPKRDGLTGGAAIASNGLAAFIGFASPAFMRHDYLLGRKNCQAFLKEEFVLDAENPIFKDQWTAAQKTKFAATVGGRPHLPIIPLLGDAAVPETADPWPRNALDPEDYRDAIEDRFKAIVEFEGSGGVIASTLSWVVAHFAEGKVADLVVNAMKKALTEAKLA